MDMRWLRYFVAVYEEGSVSAASRRLFVAQPSVSTALGQLEEHLGAKLFLRHRKGVTATAEAHELYGTAARLLGDMQALQGCFRKPKQSYALGLAITPSINARLVAVFVKRLLEQVEGMALRLVEAGTRADARVVSDRERTKEEEFIPLWEESYVLALPHGHPITLLPKVSIRDLSGVKFIERCHCELHGEVTRLLDRRGIEPEIVAKAQNEEWALALVEAGLGVALLPEGSAAGQPRVITREVAELSLVRRIGLAYRARQTPTPALRAAIGLARSGLSLDLTRKRGRLGRRASLRRP